MHAALNYIPCRATLLPASYAHIVCGLSPIGEMEKEARRSPPFSNIFVFSAADSEDLPVESPVNVRAKVLSSTTVWLQWRDLSLGAEQTLTDNRYYNVVYQVYIRTQPSQVLIYGIRIIFVFVSVSS